MIGDGARARLKKRGRPIYASVLAESIIDPDEIWVDWQYHKALKLWFLVRRYLHYDALKNSLSIFQYLGKYWSGATTFDASEDYLEGMRKGKLLYRRAK